MIANSNKGLDDNYVETNDKKVLKTAAIYEANAAGKSNLFKILTFVFKYSLSNLNGINGNFVLIS